METSFNAISVDILYIFGENFSKINTYMKNDNESQFEKWREDKKVKLSTFHQIFLPFLFRFDK